jgi:hypothetical protein
VAALQSTKKRRAAHLTRTRLLCIRAAPLGELRRLLLQSVTSLRSSGVLGQGGRMQSLTVLTASPTKLLTKNLETSETYAKVSRLRAAEQWPFTTLRELRTLLKRLARQQNSCVIRGSLKDNASTPILRRKSHFDDVGQAWVMLDIDSMRAPRKLRTVSYTTEHAEYVRAQLPAAFQEAGCVWQASASAGVDPKVLKLHMWFLLDAPLTSVQLRAWLKGAEHIDPSTLRVVQPHYTADPIGGPYEGKRLGILKGPRVVTPESINDVEDLQPVAAMTARPRGCADVSDAQIEGALKAAIARSRRLLADCNVAYQDSYTVGSYLGPAVALTTWNDAADGHETWRAYGERLARKWGKRFAELPETRHDADAYAARVLEGIEWGVANERARLAARSEKAEAEALERTKELQARLLGKLAKNAGSERVLKEVGSQLGRYRDIIGRDELLANLVTYSGLSEAQAAASIDDVAQVDVSAWREGLLMQKDEIAPTDANITTIFKRYPGFLESFEHNARTNTLELTSSNLFGIDAGAVDLEALPVLLVEWFESIGLRRASAFKVRELFSSVVRLVTSYDPFLRLFPEALLSREEAEALLPRKSRLDKWLTKHLGVVGDTTYVKAVAAKTLIGAVARAVTPGAQVDTMLVLMGEQGIGKTSAVRTLANVIKSGYRELLDMRDKDSLLVMQAGLLVEVSELKALRTSQEESIKAFFTRKTDFVRAPYARQAQELHRRMVFIGTTNDDGFLSDHANRRYWPVQCTQRSNMTADEAHELWREAALRYAAGETWWLEGEEAALQAKAAQEARAENILEIILAKQLKGVAKVSLQDAVRICFPDSNDPYRHQRAVTQALRAIGRVRVHTMKGWRWMTP